MGRRLEHLIEYLEWLDVPRQISTQSVLGGIEQRLIPLACPNCAVSYTPMQQELRELRIHCDRPSDLKFVKTTGCLDCKGTGRSGVVGLHEIAMMTEDIRGMFLQKAPDERIRQQLLDGGMTTLYESALQKVVTRQIASTTLIAYLAYGRWERKEMIEIDAATGLRCH
jgi:type II secretory ATPase GspE/PulE/Tfp pilus assembly ATPase PilB-like protein